MPVVLSCPVGFLKTNCYIVHEKDELDCAVIDPGGDGPEIARRIEEFGLKVGAIFLTHGHFDHILALPELRASTGAPVVIHEADADCLLDDAPALSPVLMYKGFGKAADRLAAEGTVIQVGRLSYRWLHTPGHTQGSCCIACEDVLFTGDTLFAGGCGRFDLPGGDRDTLTVSLTRLAELEGNPTLYPGHGPRSTLDQERAGNPYLPGGKNHRKKETKP